MELPEGKPGHGVPGLDLEGDYADVTAAADALRVDKETREALYEGLGGEPSWADLASVPRAAWEEVVAALEAGPLQNGRLERLRRAARVRAGYAPGDPRRPTAPEPASAAPGGAALQAGGPPQRDPTEGPSGHRAGGRAVKLSSVLDQTLDAPLVPIPPADVRALFASYRAKRGAYPAADIEPTHDQLAALRQVVAADAPPYADFAVFGPHGRRLLQRLAFTSFVYNPDGSWQRRELPGPPTFEAWWSSWRVLRTALLLLDVVDPEHLDNYGEHVRALNLRYRQEAWFIVYTADVRMRSEHFERLRRVLEERFTAAGQSAASSGFDPKRPWNAVFAEAVLDKT